MQIYSPICAVGIDHKTMIFHEYHFGISIIFSRITLYFFFHRERKFETRIDIRQENKGVSAARNTGLNYLIDNYPQIPYITFVDSDDIVHNDYLKKMYTSLCEQGVKLVFCGYNRFMSTIPERENAVTSGYKIIKAPFSPRDIINHSTVWGCLFCSSLLLSSRYGELRFHTDMTFGEDSIFMYELILRSDGYLVTYTVLYYYRMNSYSICSVSTLERRMADLTLRYEYCREVLLKYEKVPKDLDAYLKPIMGFESYALIRDIVIRGSVLQKEAKKQLISNMRKDFFKVLKSKTISNRTKVYYFVASLFPNYYIRLAQRKFAD